jgi:hypothetical protein
MMDDRNRWFEEQEEQERRGRGADNGNGGTGALDGDDGGESQHSRHWPPPRSTRDRGALSTRSNIYTTGNLTGYLDTIERTTALRNAATPGGDATRPLSPQEVADIQELYAILPHKVAQALERAGYRSVQQVAQTRDTELLYVRKIGTERLQSIRAAIPYQSAEGDEQEQHYPEDLLLRVKRLESKIAWLEATISNLTADR